MPQAPHSEFGDVNQRTDNASAQATGDTDARSGTLSGAGGGNAGNGVPAILRPKVWLPGLLLVIATLLAYAPAWHGKPIWDDEAHLARPELHSLSGLLRTWIEPGATQQYYPLVYSVFWVEHRLWGDSTLGYHLLNILLHASSALLLLLILHRLAVPGAWLAAAIFALHPVQVESVAWMTELKNTLSGLLFLSSLWAYLHFDQSRSRRWWTLAAGLFVLGLTAKTAIATLPAALLVLLWWQRGSLSWKSDVRPLLPFFAVGLLAGLFTAHIERKLFGAEGWEFNYSFLQRCLLAGHSLWFHLGLLFWPTHLTFMYPRWDISQSVGWQYVYPGTMLLLLAGCWVLRRWNRGPLAALLWFAGLLFPALGFFNAYSFRYSFVNDHHQYLACIGMIVLVSAGLAGLLGRWGLWGRTPGHLLCLALLGTLAGLTWQQSRMYTDMETLWRTTIAKNPTCWMAHNNLGNLLLQRGQVDDALACFEKALELQPLFAEAHTDLAYALLRKGRVDEAILHSRKAIAIQPACVEAYNNLGRGLLQKGQVDAALASFQTALKLRPDNATAHNNLGKALLLKGREDEAIAHFEAALAIQPTNAPAHNNLATLLLQKGQVGQAMAHYEAAVAIQPDNAAILNSVAWVLATCPEAAARNGARALELAQQAVRLSGRSNPWTLATLGAACAEAGRFPEAVAAAQEALGLVNAQPNTTLSNLLQTQIGLYQAGSAFRDPDQIKTAPKP
jgi:tetratricopeptide (TPR) repeat protein